MTPDDIDEIGRAREDAADRRQEVDRGQRARQIVEDPLLVAAVDAIKDRVWRDFAKSALGDDDARRMARIKLDCLDQVLRDLRRHMETGKLASQQLPLIERTLAVLTRKRK